MVLIVAGGFVVGQLVAVIFASVAVSVSGAHGSLSALVDSATPPWWIVTAELLGIWVGFGGAAMVAQRRYAAIGAGAWTPRWSDAWYLLVGAVLQFVVVVSYVPFHPKDFSAPSEKILGSSGGAALALVALLTVVGAPLLEETLFRGVLLPGLRALLGGAERGPLVAAAVVLDGLLFALAHGEWVQFPGLAIVGMVLATIYLRTRRLAPCVVAHGAFNMAAVIVLVAQGGH